MPHPTLTEALTLTPDGAGSLSARLDPFLSNAPMGIAAEKGAPFGGLMAALVGKAAREGLGIDAPIRTLTVQYLAAARFDDCVFTPTLNRGGRNVTYVEVSGGQPDRPAIEALITFGRDIDGPSIKPLPLPPRPVEDIETTELTPPFAPWFTRQVEYRFLDGPRLFGLNQGGVSELGCWMRTIDRAPLDEDRLIFLLDALYPTYFTAVAPPPPMATSVDLRADLLAPVTPETSPEGWAYFHFITRDLGHGWAVEDGTAHAPDGTPLALVRQRRRLLPSRG